MIVEFKKTAIKDINKLPKDYKISISNYLFQELPKHSSINDIRNIVKIKGYDNYFMIRIASYRIGFSYSNNKIVIYRVMNRKDLYKYFP